MKHLFIAFGSILVAASLTASAQQSAGMQYSEAVRAFRQGDSATVIRLLEPVVRSKDLKDVELGKVWLLLGASYYDEFRDRVVTDVSWLSMLH